MTKSSQRASSRRRVALLTTVTLAALFLGQCSERVFYQWKFGQVADLAEARLEYQLLGIPRSQMFLEALYEALEWRPVEPQASPADALKALEHTYFPRTHKNLKERLRALVTVSDLTHTLPVSWSPPVFHEPKELDDSPRRLWHSVEFIDQGLQTFLAARQMPSRALFEAFVKYFHRIMDQIFRDPQVIGLMPDNFFSDCKSAREQAKTMTPKAALKHRWQVFKQGFAECQRRRLGAALRQSYRQWSEQFREQYRIQCQVHQRLGLPRPSMTEDQLLGRLLKHWPLIDYGIQRGFTELRIVPFERDLLGLIKRSQRAFSVKIQSPSSMKLGSLAYTFLAEEGYKQPSKSARMHSSGPHIVLLRRVPELRVKKHDVFHRMTPETWLIDLLTRIHTQGFTNTQSLSTPTSAFPIKSPQCVLEASWGSGIIGFRWVGLRADAPSRVIGGNLRSKLLSLNGLEDFGGFPRLEAAALRLHLRSSLQGRIVAQDCDFLNLKPTALTKLFSPCGRTQGAKRLGRGGTGQLKPLLVEPHSPKFPPMPSRVVLNLTLLTRSAQR